MSAIRFDTLRLQAFRLAEVMLLPALALCLPWRAFFPLARGLSRLDGLFRVEVENAWAGARRVLPGLDDADWKRRQRLARILDQVDALLALTRGRRWMQTNFEASGDPLPEGACVALTFHYGSGGWALRHLRRDGRRLSFLSAQIEPASSGGGIRYLYERFRMWAVERVCGAPNIYVGGSMDKMRSALETGVSVVGLADPPPPFGRRRHAVELLGRDFSLPTGLLNLAEDMRLPLVVFLCSVDDGTGRWRMNLRRLRTSGEQRYQEIAGILENTLLEDGAAWYLWEAFDQYCPAG